MVLNVMYRIAGPSTPKLGQSLDMKELFAMAGGSPVSLGSLPGSLQATPSPKSHTVASGSGGMNAPSQQHRAVSSSGGANQSPTQPIFTQNNQQKPPMPARSDNGRNATQNEGELGR